MSFNYKNPITPLSSLGNISVSRTDIFGTNFSVLSTGGYMEVYSLSDLYFTIPPSTFGLVEYSANTIPIQLNIGSGSVFSPNVLTLNSDNISSGRRRIGMLVYVIEEDQIYQFQIPNFNSLWGSVTGATGPGGPTVIFSDFGTTIKSNTPQGISFISAWTANTIQDVSGGTSTNSNWKKFSLTSDLSGTCFNQIIVNELFSCSTGITVSDNLFVTSGLTIGGNIEPLIDSNSDIGTPIKRFRDINTVSGTSTVWSATTRIYTPEVDLGLDSLGNSRIINANNSIIQNDTLLGGTY